MNQSVLKNLGVKKISHAAFLVDDIDAEIGKYAALFNIRAWYKPNFVRQEVLYGGKPVAVEVSNLVGYAGPVQVELLMVKGGEGTLFDRRKHGSGLHHLGCHVRDSAPILQKAKGMNIAAVQSQILQSKGGAITTCTFLDTEKLTGIPLELLETKLAGIPTGQSRFMMNLGCILGDCTRIDAAGKKNP